MDLHSHGDILVFAGQGSQHYLSDRNLVGILEKESEKQRKIIDSFLRKCLDSFHLECDSLGSEERVIVTPTIQHFHNDTASFLSPPEPTRSNPVIETTCLYIRQILDLIIYSARRNSSQNVFQATGVCSGMVPAALAASNLEFDSDSFLDSAVNGFRVAFWIGLRSALCCQRILGDQFIDSAWLLSVFGMPTTQLEEELRQFRTESQQKYIHSIQISAIFDDTVHSISGPGPILEEFKSRLRQSSVQWRLAHVHGLYHDGPSLNTVVLDVLNDIQRRNISFPDWKDLHVPLRFPTTGVCINSRLDGASLLKTILESIFVDLCDWKIARQNLLQELVEFRGNDPKNHFRILGLGPSTNFLLKSVKINPINDRLTIIENVADLPSVEEPFKDAIAIVGLSVNYPSAHGKEEFWDILERGQSTHSKIPSSRFDATAYESPKATSGSKSSKHIANHGNFLKDPFSFDPAYFNISPREAKSMDPQQRLLLQAALEALEDSGYAPDSTDSFQRNSFGVFIGAATGDYVDNLREDIDVYYSPGTLRAFLSGRISYAFGFLGPSIVVDTACSSSLVALHQASRAIESGECTAALAGGVNTISSPDMYTGLTRAHFLSPTGQCKPFDEVADGYCRSEGCGLVVVKKLSQAIEEGDHIYGVICGIGINQCGTAKSITHPDYKTQAELFRKVLNISRIDPDTISVVEAHGTGTQAGDFAEVSSLSSVFGSRSAQNPLNLGSIKGNIGHAEAASGVAGLAKLLLMMQKGNIPPQASFNTLNPRFADKARNFLISSKLADWKPLPTASPRRALLNNFGAAGSNAALILEEYLPRAATVNRKDPVRSCHVFNISAKDEQAMRILTKNLISYIKTLPEDRIEDLCYTANARRQEHAGYRVSVTGSNLSQLLTALGESKHRQPGELHTKKRKIVFVFSGQGHAQPGMGRELLSTVPEFQRVVGECDHILSQYGFPGVKRFLLNDSVAPSGPDTGEDIVITQCALFVLEYALAKVWMQWGLIPDIVLGHSIGEYAALAIAGSFHVKDALLLVARRAELIGTHCRPRTTGMATCRATSDALQTLFHKYASEAPNLSIACLNSREDVVVAGPIESLSRFTELCKDNGIILKTLQVPYGFHSMAMEPILNDLQKCSSAAVIHDASITVGSSLHGRLLNEEEKPGIDYFVRHTREPVKFYNVLEDIERQFPDDALDFIEIGPSPSTEGMIRRSIKKAPYTFLPSLRPNQDAWVCLAPTLQSLFLRTHPVNWRRVYDGSPGKFLTSIPKYPLNPSEHFIKFRENALSGAQEIDSFSRISFELLGTVQPTSSGNLARFATNVATLSKYIEAHSVAGVPLCPASVLLEMALEAIASVKNLHSAEMHIIEKVVFENPLVYAEHMETGYVLQTDIRTESEAGWRFSCSTNNQAHCTGQVSRRPYSEVIDVLKRKQALVKRLKPLLQAESSGSLDSFSTAIIYQVIFPRVVTYSSPFLTIQHLTMTSSRLEGYGTFRISPSAASGQFVCPPQFVDTLLHAAGFIANTYVPSDIACICVGIERMMLPSSEDVYGKEMTIYCSLTDVGHSVIADSYVIDANEKAIAFVEGISFKKIRLKSFNNQLTRLIRPPASGVSIRETLRPSQEAHSLQPPNYQIEKVIQSVLHECCGISLDITSGTLLSEAGIDSLMIIEIAHLIRSRLPGFEIDEVGLGNCITLRELTATVIKASSQEASLRMPTPELIHDSSPMTPVVDFPSSPSPGGFGVTSPMENLLSTACGIEFSDSMKDLALETLGVDSLLGIEIFDEIRTRFGLNLSDDHESLFSLTLHQLEDLFAKSHTKNEFDPIFSYSSSSLSSTSSSVISTPAIRGSDTIHREFRQQSHGSPRSKVYLIHDGSGYSTMYSRISDINRTIVGISSPEPFSAVLNVNQLEDLARWYIRETDLLHEQRIILGGWSFGGVLAFEISRQLRSLGKEVQGLLLIDSPPPVNHEPLPQKVISYLESKTQSSEESTASDVMKRVRKKISEKFRHHARLLQNYHPQPEEIDFPCVFLKCSRSIDTETLCGVKYPWLGDDDFRAKSIEQWERLVGRAIPVMDIACDHFQVFEAEQIRDVSEKLRSACDILDPFADVVHV